MGSWLAKKALSFQVRLAARRCGIKKPLVWVACPPGATILDDLKAVKIVYQRTDRFEDFTGVDVEKIEGFDRDLKKKSDLVLFCSRELFNVEKAENSRSIFIDHGVDFESFEHAGILAKNGQGEPQDVRHLSRPRVGFIGGIDAHTFDPELFFNVAKLLPNVEFLMIGACSLPEGWCPLENVHLLGQRPYEEVASYMAASDVLIMPWNKSEWIKACNPVKMKEYLAVGKPVVSTYFPEVEYFDPYIAVATDAVGFAAEVEKALKNEIDAEYFRNRVRDHTWTAKAREVWVALDQ